MLYAAAIIREVRQQWRIECIKRKWRVLRGYQSMMVVALPFAYLVCPTISSLLLARDLAF